MSLLSPLWLVLGLLALPIILLYMLKLCRREVKVSSTLLWQAALRDRQANTPWQKLKRNVLLFLQLLILAGLVIALSRPAVLVRSVASGSVIVLLDGSASMAATDGSPSRFEDARTITHRLIQEMDGAARMTLILAGTHPVVLASAEADKTHLLKSLAAAQQSSGSADWKSAFALAAGAASQSSSQETITTIIVSDGGLSGVNLPSLPGEVRFIPVGNSSENVAISALSLRNSGEGNELFASLTNYGTQEQQFVFSLYQAGSLFSAQQVTLPPHSTKSISMKDLPADRSIYRASLTPIDTNQGPLDVLPLDDNAFAIGQPRFTGRALVVSQGNFFLEQVLAAMPSITPYRAIASASVEGEPAAIQIPGEPFDLYVLDGILPVQPQSGLPVLPEGNLLLINPPATTLFSLTGTFTDTAEMRIADHPLMQFVDWSGVHIAKARYIQLPAWAEVLVSSNGRPLIFAGETGGRRVAVLTFDLHDSDLPLQVAFPILISNLVQYLAPPQAIQAPDGLQPGEVLDILPGPGVQQIAIASPSGKVFSLSPGENSLSFDETGDLGVYAVNFLKKETQEAEFFAVNLFDESESDVTPVTTLQIGRQQISASPEEKLARREFWRWLAGSALIILLIEWWIYHRRQSPLNFLRELQVRQALRR